MNDTDRAGSATRPADSAPKVLLSAPTGPRTPAGVPRAAAAQATAAPRSAERLAEDTLWPFEASEPSVGFIPPAAAEAAAIRDIAASEDMLWQPAAAPDVLPPAGDDELVPLALYERLSPEPITSAAPEASMRRRGGMTLASSVSGRLAAIGAGIIVLVIGVSVGPISWWLYHRGAGERPGTLAVQSAAVTPPPSGPSGPMTPSRTAEFAARVAPAGPAPPAADAENFPALPVREEPPPAPSGAFAGRTAAAASLLALTPVPLVPPAPATASVQAPLPKAPPLSSELAGAALPAAVTPAAPTTPAPAVAPAIASLASPLATEEASQGGKFLVAREAALADAPAAVQQELPPDRALAMFTRGAMYQKPDGPRTDAVRALGWYQAALEVEQQRMPYGSPLVHVLGERIAALRSELSRKDRARADRHMTERLAAMGIKPGEAAPRAGAPASTAMPQQAVAAPRTAGSEQPSETQVGWPTARRDQIEVLQTLLAEAGLYSAVVDGKMGPHTRRAIAEAEKRAGFAQTGQPSPELHAALRQQAVPPPGGRTITPPDQGPSTAASLPPVAPARTAAKVPVQGQRGSGSSPRGARTSPSRCTVVLGSRWCWPWLR
jgi:hypothetical protein